MPDDGRRAGRGSASEASRLRRSLDITRVLRGGKPLHGRRVVVYLRPREGPSRAAWVAGRKVGGAVRRNRARRLLREVWRALAPGIGDGWELVLVARRNIDGAKADNVIKEVEELLRRERVIRG